MKRKQRLIKEHNLASKDTIKLRSWSSYLPGQHGVDAKDESTKLNRGLEMFQNQRGLHGNTGEPPISTWNAVKGYAAQ